MVKEWDLHIVMYYKEGRQWTGIDFESVVSLDDGVEAKLVVELEAGLTGFNSNG